MGERSSLRVSVHPVLDIDAGEKITIYYNGKAVEAIKGEPIAAALTAAGVRAFRITRKFHQPRGIFCAIGRCTDCIMTVNGVPNVKTCVTPADDGMKVESTAAGCEK